MLNNGSLPGYKYMFERKQIELHTVFMSSYVCIYTYITFAGLDL